MGLTHIIRVFWANDRNALWNEQGEIVEKLGYRTWIIFNEFGYCPGVSNYINFEM